MAAPRCWRSRPSSPVRRARIRKMISSSSTRTCAVTAKATCRRMCSSCSAARASRPIRPCSSNWPPWRRRDGLSLAVREAHADGAEAVVYVQDLACYAGRHVGTQEGCGIADVFGGHIAPQRRDLRDVGQHLAKAADTGSRQGLDRAGGYRIDADVAWAQVSCEKAHIGLKTRLGETHHVVARDRAHRTQVRQRQHRAGTARHESGGAARQRRETVARHVVRDAERFARSVGAEAAGKRLARGECDRMHQDIQLTPLTPQQLAMRVHGLRDAPGDGAIGGNAYDERTLSGQYSHLECLSESLDVLAGYRTT